MLDQITIDQTITKHSALDWHKISGKSSPGKQTKTNRQPSSESRRQRAIVRARTRSQITSFLTYCFFASAQVERSE
jgi:hypothetical protein